MKCFNLVMGIGFFKKPTFQGHEMVCLELGRGVPISASATSSEKHSTPKFPTTRRVVINTSSQLASQIIEYII
jgi:hypothetical protein